MKRRQLLHAGLALGGLAGAWPQGATAQSGGFLSIWSGFPAGGLGDQVTRPLLDQMRGRFPQNLVYDSKPGAGGRIAAEHVKRVGVDGNHVLQCPSSSMTLHPHVFKKLGYDTLADFVPIAGLCSYTAVFTAGPGLPAEVKSIADYIRWAKAHPTEANYGVPAMGSTLHLAGALFGKQAQLDLRAISYKGGAPLLTDLLGGQVPVAVNAVSEVLPHIRSGKLRALAVTAPARWPALPEVPSLTELGFKDIAFVDWLAWYGAAGFPADKLRQLNAVVNDALATSQMQEVFAKNGLEVMRVTPQRLGASVKEGHAFWSRVVKITGFTPED